MDKLYDPAREDAQDTAKTGKLHLHKTISDMDDDRPSEPEHHHAIRHLNMIPPTEFMALGMYPHH